MNQYELGTSGTDRITQILQSEAGRYNQQPTSMLPPAIPSMMPEPISQPIPVQVAMRQKVAEGDPQALSLSKDIKLFVGDDPYINDAAVQFMHDLPGEIDPSNKYQVYTALAQFVKQNGQSLTKMPTPQQLHIQDLGNIASGKGTNYLGLKQDAEKNIADIAASEALATQRLTGGGSGGGTTMQVFRMLKEKYPQMDDMTLLRIAQNKVSQDTYIDPNTGQQLPISGAPEALGALKYGQNYGGNLGTLTAEGELAPGIEGAKEGARQGVILSNAAELERQKKIGAGEITDIEKLTTGKQQLTTVINEMKNDYLTLKTKKAAVSTKNTFIENIGASMRQSETGQAIGKRVGTEEQSIRNKINMKVPALINAIRQATGMSAKTMDSNTELQFYKQMATDPTVDVEANIYGLERIEKMYGESSGGSGIPTQKIQIKNNADYDAVPSGSEYIDPNGITRRKP